MERCPRPIVVDYSREVNGVCTSDPNMTEHTLEEGRTKTNIRVEGRARTLYLGGKKPAEDSGTHLGSREDVDNRGENMDVGHRALTRMRHGRRRYLSKTRLRRTRWKG